MELEGILIKVVMDMLGQDKGMEDRQDEAEAEEEDKGVVVLQEDVVLMLEGMRVMVEQGVAIMDRVVVMQKKFVGEGLVNPW